MYIRMSCVNRAPLIFLKTSLNFSEKFACVLFLFHITCLTSITKTKRNRTICKAALQAQ